MLHALDPEGKLSSDELAKLKRFFARPHRLKATNLQRLATAEDDVPVEIARELSAGELLEFQLRPVWEAAESGPDTAEPAAPELTAPARLALGGDLALGRLWSGNRVHKLPDRPAQAIAAVPEAEAPRIWLTPGPFRAAQVEAEVGGCLTVTGESKMDAWKRASRGLQSGELDDLVLTPAGTAVLQLSPGSSLLVLLDAGHPSYRPERPPHIPADLAAPLLASSAEVLLHHPGLSAALIRSGAADPPPGHLDITDPAAATSHERPTTEAGQLALALSELLDPEERNLIYHNLTARSRLIVCRDCLSYQHCPSCGVPLRQLAGGQSWCAQCRSSHPPLLHCQECGSERLARAGVAAAELARELGKRLDVPVRLWSSEREFDAELQEGETAVTTSAALSRELWNTPAPDTLAFSGLEVALSREGELITRRLDPLVRLANSFRESPERLLAVTRSDSHPALLAWAEGGEELLEHIGGELGTFAALGYPPSGGGLSVRLTGEEDQLRAAREKVKLALEETGLQVQRTNLDRSFQVPHLMVAAVYGEEDELGPLLRRLQREMRLYDLVVRFAVELGL